MSDHRFIDLSDLLEPGDLIVVNDTRVRPARVVGRRVTTGGQIEMLFLEHNDDGSWDALAKPSRRLRPGVVVEFSGFTAEVVDGPEQGRVIVILDADDPEAAIHAAGSMPLPPYFTGELENPERYQTMFASAPGSAAAPTAGLHFTDEVTRRLETRGIAIATVDLHVSIDTFRPLAVDDIEDHEMHSEWCAVPEETSWAVDDTRDNGGRVVAIGTTVVRTLETMADGTGRVQPGERRTDLFLRPGSEITVVDLLVTNFHLPGSTLLVLLAAFMGDSWRNAYDVALGRQYRFLSFGDAMLAARNDRAPDDSGRPTPD